jgi:hypothetical protein
MTTLDLSGAVWRKSSRSGDNGGQCVEVAHVTGGAAIRDSKNPTGPILLFAPHQWAGLRRGLIS